MGLCRILCAPLNGLTKLCDFLSHFVNFGLRAFVSWEFFNFGLQKMQDYEGTVTLFKSGEYNLPAFLSPELAACLSSSAELVLPVFLVLGLGARLPAVLLFALNACMVAFYPSIHPENWCEFMAVSELMPHVVWGLIFGLVAFYGPGKISIDHLCKKKCECYQY